MSRLLSLALATLLFALSPVSAQDAADVVFLLDSSNSMKKYDQEGLRRHLMELTVHFMEGRGGDRVGVVQFAGWFETQKGERKVVVFPLTAVGPDFRAAFDAAIGKTEIFGQASDINVAFEKGLKEIERQRGSTQNPWWIILLTDSVLGAFEPAEVRQEYLDRANKLFNVDPDDADIDQINKAAIDYFRSDVLPGFQGSGFTLTPVNLSSREVKKGSPLRDLAGDAPIATLTDTPLKDLLIPMLGASALHRSGRGGFHGYSVHKETSVRYPVSVYAGATSTRVLAFSRGAKLDAKVIDGPDGVEVLGDGPYRVVQFGAAPAGDYTIEFTAAGGKTIEVVAYTSIPWQADVKMLTPEAIGPGEEAKFEIFVSAGGEPLTGKMLKGLKAKVEVLPPGGKAAKSEVAFGSFVHKTKKDDPLGEITFTFRMPPPPSVGAAVPDFEGGARVLKVRVAHILKARFENAEVIAGEVGRFFVEGQEGLPGDLVANVKVKGGGGEQTVPVTYEDGKWTGTFDTAETGTYEVVEDGPGPVLIRSETMDVVSEPFGSILKRWLPYILAVLALLLLIAWFLMLARWNQHQLRVLQFGNLDTKRLLKDLPGWRSATGTEEAPDTSRFKISGMKFTSKTVKLKALKSGVEVLHNGAPLTESVPVAHLDDLAVVPVEGTMHQYIYLERDPTDAELAAMLAFLGEGDELYVEED